jgi:hypothetical protein
MTPTDQVTVRQQPLRPSRPTLTTRPCCVLNVKEWLCSNQYRIGAARMMRVLWPLGVARRWEAPSRPALR